MGIGIGIPWGHQDTGAAPPAWTPDSVAGLQLWLDASDAGTLFQNSGGTGAVTSDGDPVGYWGDKSGNARHVTQATSGRRPLYKPSGLDTGKAGLLFDDVDDFLSRTGITLSGAQTVAVVCKINGLPSASEFDTGVLVSDGTRQMWLLFCSYATVDPTTFCCAGTGGASMGVAEALTTNKQRIVIRYDGVSTTSASSYDFQRDGVSKTVNAKANIGLNTSQIAVGARDTAVYPADLLISEILVWNVRLTDGERTSLDSYLAAKW